MSRGGFDYSGFEQLYKQIERMEREADSFFRSFLLKQALDVLGKTKKNTPTDTGLLKNAWQIGDAKVVLRGKVLRSGKHKGKLRYRADESQSSNATLESVNRVGDKLEVTIFNPVEYASFVEYGHMNRSRTKWINGRFMCTMAINDVQRKMPARFEKEFKQWCRSLGADVR